MPQIPLYEQNVMPTTQVGGAQMPVGAPVARAVSQLGGTVASLGADYAKRKSDLRKRAEEADYETGFRSLKNDIEIKRNEYLQSGKSYSDFETDVMVPMMDDFQKSLGERGYSKTSQELFSQRWGADRQGMLELEAIERSSMELADYTTRIKNDAFLKINSDDETVRQEGLNQLDTLTDAIGAGEVAKLKSLGVYQRNTNKMLSMTDPNAIEEFASGQEARSMEPQQYQAFLNMANSHVRKLTADEFAPAKKEIGDAIRRGEATVGLIQSYGLPENEERVYIKILDGNMQKSYTKNETEIDELTAEVDTFLAGKYAGNSKEEYDNLLERIEESELPPAVKLDILIPVIEGQGDTSLNAPFFIGKKNQSVYDKMTSLALNQYRDAFNAANAGQKASIKMYGFANGYRHMMSWIAENKGELDAGRMPSELHSIVEEAVRPAVTNRVKLEEQKRVRDILGGNNTVEKDEIDSIWDEV